MFNYYSYKSMYRRFLGPLARPILLAVNNGTNFDVYPAVTAHVSTYKESELVSGGSIQIGDLKVILLTENLPVQIKSMGMKDRIIIDDKYYSIFHWDAYTRTVGSEGIAIEITCRGGGLYVPGEMYNIISEDGDLLITEGYIVTE